MHKPPTSTRINRTSGEWKVSGMHPKARALVWRFRHRRLHVTPVAPERTVTDFTLHNPSVSALRTHSVRKAPKNGAVVDAFGSVPEPRSRT
jgi:hypothetical protein